MDHRHGFCSQLLLNQQSYLPQMRSFEYLKVVILMLEDARLPALHAHIDLLPG